MKETNFGRFVFQHNNSITTTTMVLKELIFFSKLIHINKEVIPKSGYKIKAILSHYLVFLFTSVIIYQLGRGEGLNKEVEQGGGGLKRSYLQYLYFVILFRQGISIARFEIIYPPNHLADCIFKLVAF